MPDWFSAIQLLWLCIACFISYIIGRYRGVVGTLYYLIEQDILTEYDLEKLDSEKK